MWGKNISVNWLIRDHQSKTTRQVHSVGINLPATPSSNGHGIYGYLFGDRELLANTTMLQPHFAQKGYVATRAFFLNNGSQKDLWDHDSWSFVAINGDGSEIIRQKLPLPSQVDLDAAYQTHRKSIEVAWTKRNAEKLTTTSADNLPRDQANCLLSTPAARDDMEHGSISF